MQIRRSSIIALGQASRVLPPPCEAQHLASSCQSTSGSPLHSGLGVDRRPTRTPPLDGFNAVVSLLRGSALGAYQHTWALGAPPRRWSMVGRGCRTLARRHRQGAAPHPAASQRHPSGSAHPRGAGDGPPRPRPDEQRGLEPRSALPTVPHPPRQSGAPAAPAVDVPRSPSDRGPVHGALWMRMPRHHCRVTPLHSLAMRLKCPRNTHFTSP